MNNLLTSLSAFLRVAETLNFTTAADSLGVSRAVLTRRIKALETTLDTQLFYRTTRKVTLTSEGLELQRRAQSLVIESQKLIEDLQVKSRHELKGHIHISASVIIAWSVLQGIVAEFQKLHPGVSFEITTEDRDVKVIEEGVDIAFKVGNNPDPSLVAKKIGFVDSILVASPLYLRDNKLPQTPEDLPEHVWLMNTYFGPTITLYDQEKSRRTQITFPKTGNYSCNNTFLCVNACRLGMGIAMLPTDYVEDDVLSGALVHILPNWLCERFNFYALYPNSHLSPQARAFLNFTHEKMMAAGGRVYSKTVRKYKGLGA
jgi:DNA-binding transcriptional LysR family regulator